MTREDPAVKRAIAAMNRPPRSLALVFQDDPTLGKRGIRLALQYSDRDPTKVQPKDQTAAELWATKTLGLVQLMLHHIGIGLQRGEAEPMPDQLAAQPELGPETLPPAS